ncbi:MAG: VWA domain-containing protein [Acidobacteriota bacterium]
MIRPTLHCAAVFVVGLWTVTSAAAWADDIDVLITRPEPGESLFDETILAVEVRASEAITEVEFLIDGRSVGKRTQPPYEVRIDVGGENRDRMIEVTARGESSTVGRAKMLAPRIPVHDELEVDLQQLYVTVTRRDGTRALDLTVGDFVVRDERVAQQITTFERGDIPFTAIIMVDGSDSMRGRRLEGSLTGAQRFVSGMRPLDEAKLMVFADRLLDITPWSNTGAPLARALETVSATGGTAIFDHLHMALTLLEQRQGRRVVILLTDGWDSVSALSAEQIRRVARRSQSLIYWVRLAGDEPGPGRELGKRRYGVTLKPVRLVPTNSWRNLRASRRAYELLEDTVRESGGQIVSVPSVEAISATFEDILAELREQYALGYDPEPRRNDGAWRSIEVELVPRGLKARTRGGYVDR